MWLLAVATKGVQFEWFAATPYATALALGLIGAILLQKRSIALGFCLLVLGQWVNASLFLVLIPLIFFRYILQQNRRGMVRSLGFMVLSAATGILGKELSHSPNTDSGFVPISQWPIAWIELFRRASKAGVADSLAHHYLLLWLVIPASVGVAILLKQNASRYPIAVAMSWVITSVGYWLFVGTLIWVKLNGYNMRYIYSAMFLLSMAIAVLALAPFQDIPNRLGSLAALISSILVFILAAYQYGMPSRRIVQRTIHQKFGTYTNDLLSTSAILISGNYWRLWASVFDANVTLYDRKDLHFIYGVGYRDSATLPHWIGLQTVCAAVPVGDPEGPYWLTNSPRHFVLIRRVNSIDFYCSLK